VFDAGIALGQKFDFSVKREAIHLSSGAAAELTAVTCVMNAVCAAWDAFVSILLFFCLRPRHV
jgi:hypothetical protein